MAMEKLVLETLKFDLVIDLPYNHLLKFSRLLKGMAFFCNTIDSLSPRFSLSIATESG
jgi:hypothetical protein